MTPPPALQASALVVHVFIAVNGEHRAEDHRYLLAVWRACGSALGMTEEIAVTGTAADPPGGWDSPMGESGLLAVRSRPGPGVHQVVLRREHDTFCVSVMREPAPAEGISWAQLDRQWSDVAGKVSPGVIGTARLYLARLAGAGAPTPDGALAVVVRSACPADPAAAADWWERGVTVPEGFAVWEASSPADGRDLRKIIVVAAADRDPELSAWAWISRDRSLPPFGRYLLHAAKLRYQRRVWGAGQGFRELRQEADVTVRRLLSMLTPRARSPQRWREPAPAELVEASHELASLQARALGLVDSSTRLREMRRTVVIAAANMTALSDDANLGGLFADDRALAGWLGEQLDDDATYLEAAQERVRQVSALTDQLVQRGQQRRQERFNLGLTGVIGAILMSLAAIQSLSYSVPLPPPVKPAVVTALGAVALLASLVVLRFAVPDRRWPLALVHAGFGLLAASLGWIVVSALTLGRRSERWTWLISGAAFVVAVAVAAGLTWIRRRRRAP
ncbi:MAG TPA: CATRA conflict system CASPASE/TPR repeat-associated protein [Pseudonocardiaceae bacterium]|nr:CATRA conflict system CASPASE/TPR repeat-associated protein [Pseudonocardiaceae bacterium]